MPRVTLQHCLVSTGPGANLWFEVELHCVYVTHVSPVSPHFSLPTCVFPMAHFNTAAETMLIQDGSEFRVTLQCHFSKYDWLLCLVPCRASHAHHLDEESEVLVTHRKGSCIKGSCSLPSIFLRTLNSLVSLFSPYIYFFKSLHISSSLGTPSYFLFSIFIAQISISLPLPCSSTLFLVHLSFPLCLANSPSFK